MPPILPAIAPRSGDTNIGALHAAQRANVPADEIVEVGPAVPEFSDRLREWADAVGPH